MNLSIRWLNDFVDINMPPRAFSEAMTMSGSKVESFCREDDVIKNVVVGKILSIEKHPDADKLQICQIDAGESEPLQIVTAAQNVAVGDMVPVAKNNSVLANGTKIKKGKLRGVASNGMLCSVAELGVTVNDFPYAIEDGIFILQEDCKVGQSITEAIGLNDTKIEFEITSNRPDCFSVIGLAREAAATFGKELKLHTPAVNGGSGDCSDMIDVKIENPELCPIYTARVVKNVKIAPSPRWLRERLRAMNVRPINNIVDITNYVMLEYGQPMHAFDLRQIEGGKIRIRTAKDGETIKTLDGEERKLCSKNLVIADDVKPMAVAGVMGGENSGIQSDSSTIVFESANFSGSSIRLTAKQLGMRTDSSARFEKGLDPNCCVPALTRACELVELLGAGEVMDGMIKDDRFTPVKKTVKLDCGWINSFLSTDISEQKMVEILEKIDCFVENGEIIIPSFRPDLQHKADIAEEIARFYGYNNIKSTNVGGGAQGKYSDRQKFDMLLSGVMLSMGLSEIMTYSFVSPKYYDKVLMPKDSPLRNSVVISNPLGEDSSVMRTTALPSMMEILAKNYNNRNPQAYLYELGREYIPTGKDTQPLEKNVLTGGMYGDDVNFFEIKGIVELLLKKCGIKYGIYASSDEFGYHPGRCAVLTAGDDILGTIGQMHPQCAENYGMPCEVYTFRLDADIMYKHSSLERHYTPLPKYPAITRDLAVICDNDTPVLTLEEAISRGCGNLLESIKLFDVYNGSQIESGKKSVAFSVVLRSKDATLTDEQAANCMKKSLKELEKLGAALRS